MHLVSHRAKLLKSTNVKTVPHFHKSKTQLFKTIFYMKANKILILLVFVVSIILSGCASKKHRYNQCPTFSQAQPTEKVQNIG